MTRRGGDHTVAAPRPRVSRGMRGRRVNQGLVVLVAATVSSIGIVPTAFAEGEWTDPDGDGIYAPPTNGTGGEWTDPDGDGIYAPPTNGTSGEWTDPDGDGIYAPPTPPSDPGSTTPAPGEWTDQTAEVVVSDIAIADTGANTITTPADSSAGTAGLATTPAAITTGTADAVGSVDRTTLDQQATAALTDEATADIVQLVIVFNVGAAQAVSGGNATGDPTAGVLAGGVTTGDAVAIGNDGTVAVLQAASADSTGLPDGSSQEAITVRIGISVANTGANGAPGGGGPVITGDASAIGNDATTDVTQMAVATGSGTAQLSIDQRALVLNIGLALANTGGNGDPLDASITAAAGGFVDSPDEAHATALLSLLLPSLLVGSPTGTGGVITGDATAIGNQSSTIVDQSALATASGDGTATIDQQVVVTNMGIAVANTGNNGAGPAVDPDTSAAIASIAGFVGSLMHDLQQWDGSSELLGRGLTLDVGGRQIVLDGRLAGQLLTGDPDTPEGRRTIRQLSAIINLGIAVADSGGNASSAPLVMIEPTAQAGTVSVSTGDATATNRSTVIVCQRDDRPDAVCPTAPGEDTGAGTGVAGVDDGSGVAPEVLSAGLLAPPAGGADADGATLPVTGNDPTVLATWAAAVLALGLVASRLAATRRSEPS